CNSAIIPISLLEVGHLVTSLFGIARSCVLAIPRIFLSTPVYVVASDAYKCKGCIFPFCFSRQTILRKKYSVFPLDVQTGGVCWGCSISPVVSCGSAILTFNHKSVGIFAAS